MLARSYDIYILVIVVVISFSYACIQIITTVNPFSVNMHGGVLKYVHECIEFCNSITIIDVNNLKDVCFHMKFENGKEYIFEPVNNIEFE